MLAVGLRRFGGPEALQVIELPTPVPGPGEIRVRVHAVGVNPGDLLFRSGGGAAVQLRGRRPPYIPGMDAAGLVDGLGPGAGERLAIGDRVVVLASPSGAAGGTYAQQVVVPAASVVRAPTGATLTEASTLLLNGLAAQLAMEALALRRGQVLAVNGAAGAVGGYAVELGRAAGLTVIADSAAADVALVRSLGAHVTLDRGHEWASAVRRASPAGVDGVVDAAGQGAVVLVALRDHGALAVLRQYRGRLERNVTVTSVSAADSVTDTNQLAGLVTNVEDSTLTLRVADVLPAAAAAAAHRRFAAGGVRGRLVLDFT